MNVYELVEKMGGEICRGRARVRVDGKIVVVGQLNGDDMMFTEEGRQLLADSPKPAAEESKKRGRPAKVGVVESDQISDNLFDTPDAGLT